MKVEFAEVGVQQRVSGDAVPLLHAADARRLRRLGHSIPAHDDDDDDDDADAALLMMLMLMMLMVKTEKWREANEKDFELRLVGVCDHEEEA